MSGQAACLATLFLAVGLGLDGNHAHVRAAEPAASEPSPKLQYLIDRFRDVRIQPIKPRAADCQLRIRPLIEFHNPVSGAEGAVFVWTSDGRPMVLSKCHVNDIKLYYIESSTSVAVEPFVMKRGNETLWSCTEPGVTFRPLPNVESPADREVARLIQMRTIARRYRLLSLWGDEQASEWELRLLPTPLYRYTSPSAKVIDGGLFGYAQGTNPEGIVIVEAVQTAEGVVWQAAVARLTGYAVKGWLDDALILDAPAYRTHGPFPTHRHVYEKPRPYPFPKKSE